ncbi:unnamed protein product [Enterobius vermicularis]|uniref:PITH domain-containing protein n=1 Tax=Enterobius vermicularis TaxID=51028 RepID=A0A0N4UWA5_ENTVE|nr:unnamed protein product [Enterobius vermicularis]
MSHRHGDGQGCSAEQSDIVTFKDGIRYTMNSHIDLPKVTVLNEAIDGSGVKVFKEWEKRIDRTDFVESDVDEELLFNIPFTGRVKITGIVVVGGLDDSHPSCMKLFKDRPSMSFDDVKMKADQEFSLKQDPDGRVDYALKAAVFPSLTHLTIFFPANFGSDHTRIYYIGLRGEYLSDARQKVAITAYEARPQLKDHKGEIPDSVQKHVF